MLFSLGNFLFGRDEAVGIPPKLPTLLGDALNLTPKMLRKSIYKIGGVQESISLKKLKKVDDRMISDWITEAYPPKKYPGVIIGSSNGALIHIAAMLGIPWVPQTVMLALNRKMDPDELLRDVEWGKRATAVMREKLSHFRFHQMHDPIQDRVMVANMAYFRIKRLKLGKRLEEFLKDALMPGATIFISDCDYKWPSHRVDEFHYFQTGGLGDVGGYEYAKGSGRIERFLKQQKSRLKKWQTPEPLVDVAEAEWGFAKELGGDIKRFSEKNGFSVKRLAYGHPEDLSPLAADLSALWYRRNGIRSSRLLIECFALVEPWWAAKTGSIPYWAAFNTKRSLGSIKDYVEKMGPWDEIYAMVMSNAVEGIGFIPIKEWQDLLRRARKNHSLIGVDEDEYPYDMGSFIKYFKDLQKKIEARNRVPMPMCFEELYAFIDERGKDYKVSLKNEL